MITGAIAVVATIAGGLAGEHWALPLEDWTSRVSLAIGLGELRRGPSLMIASHLPRTCAVLLGVTLAVGVVVVSRRLQKRRSAVREISIHPGSQRSSR